MNTPQIDDLLTLLGGSAAAILAIIALLLIVRKWLVGSTTRDIQDIRKELHPNGGSSMRDAIDRIAERQQEILKDVRELRGRVDDHIDWHLSN